MRLVYTRRLSRVWTASAGYSFGRGQQTLDDVSRIRPKCSRTDSSRLAALQLGAGFDTGTTSERYCVSRRTRPCLPSIHLPADWEFTILVEHSGDQDLPSFGLPVRAEAVLDARNLLDLQANTENGEMLTQLGTAVVLFAVESPSGFRRAR